MNITKGTLLSINHSRKGQFYAIAKRDFDTEKETFYPVSVARLSEGGDGQTVRGLSLEGYWEAGEDIPCRGEFCKVKIV